jgi:hypothetical protein
MSIRLKVGERYRARSGRETLPLWWSIYTEEPFTAPDWARLWKEDGSAIWSGFRDDDLVGDRGAERRLCSDRIARGSIRPGSGLRIRIIGRSPVIRAGNGALPWPQFRRVSAYIRPAQEPKPNDRPRRRYARPGPSGLR